MNIPQQDLNVSKIKSEMSKFYKKLISLIEESDGKIKISNNEFMYIYCLIYKTIEETRGDSEDKEYSELSREIDEVIKNYLGDYLKMKNNVFKGVPDSLKILELLIEIVMRNLIILRWIGKAFYYFQKSEYKSTNRSIFKIGHDFLKSYLFDQNIDIIRKSVFTLLDQDRKGIPIEKLVLKRTLYLIMDISKDTDYNVDLEISPDFNYYFKFPKDEKKSECLIKNFEVQLIENSSAFYKEIVKQNTRKPLEYVNYMETLLQIENERANMFYPKCKNEVLNVIKEILITNELNNFIFDIDEGLYALLKKEDNSGIKAIFSFISKTPDNISVISDIYGKFVEELILNLKEFEKNPIEYMVEGIKILKKVDFEAQNLFNNNILISKNTTVSMKNAFNKNSQVPRFLSFYVDFELKKGMKGNIESEIRVKIEYISKFLDLLFSKDTFIHYHSINFSKRLVNNISLSLDAEKDFISILKTMIGSFSVNKLEMLMNDVEESKNINSQFITSAKKTLKLDFNVKVITSSCWPDSPMKYLIPLPSKISETLEKFETRYKEIFNGTRRLVWLFNEGMVEVSASFSKKYIFELTVLQSFILLKLNSGNLTIHELMGETDPNAKEEFQANVNSLLQSGILKQENTNNMLLLSDEDTSKLIINTEFTSYNKKLNLIPKYRKVITSKETKINGNIEKEREMLIDSALVRIMKANRTLQSNELISKVAEMVKIFNVQPSQAKKRIDVLISREYICRDNSDPSLIVYIP